MKRLDFQQTAFGEADHWKEMKLYSCSFSLALVDKYVFNDPNYLVTEMEFVCSPNIDVCLDFNNSSEISMFSFLFPLEFDQFPVQSRASDNKINTLSV